MEWKYLVSEPFQSRQVLAAHYVRDCANVVEVGGYKMPITFFLTCQHDNVLVLDPLVTPFSADRLCGYVCNVSHVALNIQDWPGIPFESKFGLVCVGMEIRGNPEQFYSWVKASEVAVLEFPPDYDPSVKLFENVMARCGKHVHLQIDLDLSGNDFGERTGSWHPRPRRRLVVLK